MDFRGKTSGECHIPAPLPGWIPCHGQSCWEVACPHGPFQLSHEAVAWNSLVVSGAPAIAPSCGSRGQRGEWTDGPRAHRCRCDACAPKRGAPLASVSEKLHERVASQTPRKAGEGVGSRSEVSTSVV